MYCSFMKLTPTCIEWTMCLRWQYFDAVQKRTNSDQNALIFIVFSHVILGYISSCSLDWRQCFICCPDIRRPIFPRCFSTALCSWFWCRRQDQGSQNRSQNQILYHILWPITENQYLSHWWLVDVGVDKSGLPLLDLQGLFRLSG